MKPKLALIQDYHPNFYDTYKELEKHYTLTMFGDSYYPVPDDINLVEWKTYRIGKVYLGDAVKLRYMLKGFSRAMIKDFSQPKSLQAINVCKLEKIKYTITIQNITRPYTLRFLTEFVGRDTPILCTILKEYSLLSNYFNNVEYIPFAIARKTKTKVFKKKKKLNILCVSKLDQERKDHFTLIKACRDLDVNITFVGSCKENNDYSRKLGYVPNIDFKKDLNKKELEKEYLKADLFVLPAYNEPANYSVLEAMSYGLPVICSDTNGTACYLHWFSVFRSKDVKHLESKIKFFLTNLKYSGDMNLQYTKEDHNPKLIVKKIKEVLKLLD